MSVLCPSLEALKKVSSLHTSLQFALQKIETGKDVYTPHMIDKAMAFFNYSGDCTENYEKVGLEVKAFFDDLLTEIQDVTDQIDARLQQ